MHINLITRAEKLREEYRQGLITRQEVLKELTQIGKTASVILAVDYLDERTKKEVLEALKED